MPMAGIPTETVTVISRKTVYDDLHEPVSEAVDEREVDAVVAHTVHLPRDMAGIRLKGCSVRVRGEELRVVGDPRPYAPEACPGRWCYPVELEAADG